MIILPTRDKSQVQPQTNQTSKTNRELVLDNTNIEMSTLQTDILFELHPLLTQQEYHKLRSHFIRRNSSIF